MQQREERTGVKHCTVLLQKTDNELTPQAYQVLNISRGGLCFECNNEEFELNEILSLNLSNSQKSIHQASGRICYCNQSDHKKTAQYGISFLDKFVDMGTLR